MSDAFLLSQRGWSATEEVPEPGREVTVAGKTRLKRDPGEIVAAVEHRGERLRQPLAQHVLMDRGADQFAENVAQMKG